MDRMPVSVEDMRRIGAEFDIRGPIRDARPYGTGHINDTYAVVVDRGGTSRRYIFQRINTGIFRNVDALMDNVMRVTRHIRSKLEHETGRDPDREVLTLIPTRAGASYWRTDSGDAWRCYLFIEGARTYDLLENNRQAYEAAKAFAGFQKMLADLPPPPLNETIQDFHHTPKRFRALEEAVTADPRGRRKECVPEIEAAVGLKSETGRIVDAIRDGALPLRVTHNDTKINNVMMDETRHAALCVIDLDTVMPGSVLYDFGDQVRTSVGHFEENEKDLSKVYVDLDCFEGLARGYLDGAGDFLTDREIEWLVFGGLLMTYEVGIRFLTDYLRGDVYFRIHYPEENLDRARTQLALVRDIRKHDSAMRAIVERHRRRRG